MKGMKAVFLTLALLALAPLAVHAVDMQAYKQMVESADAKQAMALANQWKWTNNTIKTYVTPMEVVFEFPDNTSKTVALPEDKMVVAIAPYLNYTHQ